MLIVINLLKCNIYYLLLATKTITLNIYVRYCSIHCNLALNCILTACLLNLYLIFISSAPLLIPSQSGFRHGNKIQGLYVFIMNRSFSLLN